MSLVTILAARWSKACHSSQRRVWDAKKLQSGNGITVTAATRGLLRVPAVTARCPGQSVAVTVTTLAGMIVFLQYSNYSYSTKSAFVIKTRQHF